MQSDFLTLHDICPGSKLTRCYQTDEFLAIYVRNRVEIAGGEV
jgi:hypothetical protein